MTGQAAAAALMEAWLASGYDPTLVSLSFPRYPLRELRPRPLPDGAVELTISKRGFGYKYRGRRPCVPPRVDLRGVQERLSVHLPPSITIRSVADAGTSIIITMEEKMTISEFFAKIAAAYKAYVARENAKLRAAATANAAAMAEQQMRHYYTTVAEIVMQAANNVANADPRTLRPVLDFSQISCAVPVLPRRSRATGQTVFGWCFRLHRSRAFVQPAIAMQRLLQNEVAAICVMYGFPALRVFLQFAADNVVNVWVTPLEYLTGGSGDEQS